MAPQWQHLALIPPLSSFRRRRFPLLHTLVCLLLFPSGPYPPITARALPSPPTSSDHGSDLHYHLTPRHTPTMASLHGCTTKDASPEAPSLARGSLITSNNVCPIQCLHGFHYPDEAVQRRVLHLVSLGAFSMPERKNMQSLLAPDPQHMVTRGPLRKKKKQTTGEHPLPLP